MKDLLRKAKDGSYRAPPVKRVYIPKDGGEKQRVGGKVRKKYDKAASPCDRLLVCPKVSAATKESLRQIRVGLDPMDLSKDINVYIAPKMIFLKNAIREFHQPTRHHADWLDGHSPAELVIRHGLGLPDELL